MKLADTQSTIARVFEQEKTQQSRAQQVSPYAKEAKIAGETPALPVPPMRQLLSIWARWRRSE